MAENIYTQLPGIRSRISFQPLIRLWKEIVLSNNSAAAKICNDLIIRFEKVPELLKPITDYNLLQPHQPLIEEAMMTIFPASFSETKKLHSVAMPFSSKPFYASSFFKSTYLDSRGEYLYPLDPQVAKNVAVAKVHLAYKLILKKWYDIDLIGDDAVISSYPERHRNIHNYFELEWDSEFIDVTAEFELPPLPEQLSIRCHHVRDLARYPELADILPLEKFTFDGLVITRIREVSERETLNNIQNILQQDNSLEDPHLLRELQQELRYLFGMENADVGFVAFYDNENVKQLVTTNYSSILLKNLSGPDEIIDYCQKLSEQLTKHPNYFWWHDRSEVLTPIDIQLHKNGWQSALITALFHKQKVVGCLEVVTRSGADIDNFILLRLEYVRELMQVALQNYRQQMLNTVARLVKENFTAIQSSVEWKFNNAAIRYLLNQHSGNSAKMDSVVFEDVFPLYGLIDIRNSSGERNRAVQEDMLQQLQWVKKIVEEVQKTLSYPLLLEIQSRIEKHIDSISHFLFAADEQVVQHFLRTEATELLEHLAKAAPQHRDDIDAYFEKVSNNFNLLNVHRTMFEQSVTEINIQITEHLDNEQVKVQHLYPHYFERFVSDGVEFNMYIGQSISPKIKFDYVHLKNLKLWQLSFLASAAQQVHNLGKKLALPLETTQLVLVYNEPISIRFRNAERKFDIDGVHHARYEVVKKRIDKVLIKGTNERLTQPGTLAIVYSTDEDAHEYLQYIEYLKMQNLLKGTAEIFELEELQAVSGLKALRVAIQFDQISAETDQRKSIAGAKR